MSAVLWQGTILYLPIETEVLDRICINYVIVKKLLVLGRDSEGNSVVTKIHEIMECQEQIILKMLSVLSLFTKDKVQYNS